MLNKIKKNKLLKHTAYGLVLFVLYVLQTAPRLFVIGGAQPMILVPFAVAIAMYDGEFIGGVYGALAGLLCDMSSFSLFGYNGFIICLCCIAVGLLVIYLMRCNMSGYLLFVFLTLLVRGSIEFLFAYGMWGFESVWKLYVYSTLPTILYSVAVSPPLYWLVGRIHRRFPVAASH